MERVRLLVLSDLLMALWQALIVVVVLVIGPAIGGLVAVLASPAWVFVANGVSFLVSAVLVASIRARSRPTDVTGEGPSPSCEPVPGRSSPEADRSP
ncbi:MAG TPA: hypothetical protein VFR74_02275 [Jiangellales bacterium]|nr:hypothetical protein [Jiangellales bacterium]